MRMPYCLDKQVVISILLILNRRTIITHPHIIIVLTRINGNTYCFNVLCFSNYIDCFECFLFSCAVKL